MTLLACNKYQTLTGLENDHTGLENDHTGLENDNTGLENDHTGLENDHTGLENDHTGLENHCYTYDILLQKAEICLTIVHLQWALTQENLSSGFTTREGSGKQQRLTTCRLLEICMLLSGLKITVCI